MLGNLVLNKSLWVLTSLLTLIAAIAGIVDNSIYTDHGMINMQYLPGTVSQDIMAVVFAVILLGICIFAKDNSGKLHIIAAGILSFTFYGYGVYCMERVYNPYYFLYIGICSFSFYGIVLFLSSLKGAVIDKVKVPSGMRFSMLVLLILIPAIFYPLWSGDLVDLIKAGTKKEFAYSIYVLDLCFEMPAFLITAYLTLRNRGLGLVLAPVMMIKGFTVLFPLVVGDLIKPLFDQPRIPSEMAFYLSLACVFLIMAVLYMWKLRFVEGSGVGESDNQAHPIH